MFGHLPTGVTAITAYGPDGPVGMAANSLTSLSLDPPLLLVCPAKSSTTWPRVREAGRFCVNILSHDQAQVARQLAAKSGDRFAELGFDRRIGGPGIAGALAWIDCELEREHDGGDHTIAVGRVLALEATVDLESRPLVFFRGGYGSYHEPGAAAPRLPRP